MNLYVTLYQKQNDDDTYMKLSATPLEQQAERLTLQATEPLAWLKCGEIPITITEEYAATQPPTPINLHSHFNGGILLCKDSSTPPPKAS